MHLDCDVTQGKPCIHILCLLTCDVTANCCTVVCVVGVLKGVVPRSAVQEVLELFVADDQLASATAEAAALPSVDITKVGHCPV